MLAMLQLSNSKENYDGYITAHISYVLVYVALSLGIACNWVTKENKS